MQFTKKMLLGAVAALGMTAVAQAAPLPPATTVGQNLLAGGTAVTAAFLFASAADDSDLDVSINMGGTSFLFSNSNSVTANATAIGGTALIQPINIGDLMTFTLENQTVAGSYSTGIASTNVAYISNAASVAQVETALSVDLSVAAETALLALIAAGPTVVVAFEDRPLNASDQDFNDLIFAFSPTFTQVPEPATLALFGAGLLGLGLARRRRRA